MKNWIDKTFVIAIGASFALHGGGISIPLVYEYVKGKPFMNSFLPPVVPPMPEIAFKFIDSPDQVVEEKETEKTKVISDKSTKARDQIADTKQHKKSGPSAQIIDEAHQLAKKITKNRMVYQVKGGQPTTQKFRIPTKEEPIKKEEPITEAKETKPEEKKQVYKLKKAEKNLTVKVNEKILEKQKKKLEKQKQNQQTSNQVSLGNSSTNRQEMIFNPATNIDRYDSERIQKFLATAVNVGEFSFNARKHVLGSYLKKLKSKITPTWHLNLESKSFGNILKKKKVVIGFKILRNGELGELMIIKDYGENLFNKLCIETIRGTAPFDPLPDSWFELSGLDYLNLTYTFTVI